MPNINEITTSVTKWDRVGTIIIRNPYEQMPTMEIYVERAKLEDGVFGVESAEMWNIEQNFTEEFPLYNPLTHELIEGMTGSLGMMHTLMYSLFFNEVDKRRSPSPPVTPPAPDPIP